MGAKTKGLKRLANQINRAYSAGAEQGNQLAQAELKAALKARRNQTWRSASGYRRADGAWKAQDAADNVSLVSNGGMGITEESLAAYEKAQESTKSAWKYAQSKNSSGKMGKTKEQIRAENRQRLDDAETEMEYRRGVADGSIQPSQPKSRTGLLGQETRKAPSTTPTSNQRSVGATGSQSAAPSASTPAQRNTQLFGDFDAKLKAARGNGKADAYMADRIQNDISAFQAHYDKGEFDKAASIIGASGKYNAKNSQALANQGYKHFNNQIDNGPGVQDYIFGHKIPSTAVGIAIAGGAISAINSNGGRRSNADLYSSPF